MDIKKKKSKKREFPTMNVTPEESKQNMDQFYLKVV